MYFSGTKFDSVSKFPVLITIGISNKEVGEFQKTKRAEYNKKKALD